MDLSATIPAGGGGVVTLRNPWSFAQRRLQIPPTQHLECVTKSY